MNAKVYKETSAKVIWDVNAGQSAGKEVSWKEWVFITGAAQKKKHR